MPEVSQSELDRLRRKAEEVDSDAHLAKLVGRIAVAVIFALVGVVFAWKLVSPQLNLYRANTEKKEAIAEAKALAESAEFKAQAEVTRAAGVAEANQIIAESITPEYIRWLYVDQLDRTENQIIYIPTEGGIPILEAGSRPIEVTASADD